MFIQRIVAYLFGIVFIVVGIFGFIPLVAPKGALFGIFMVNPLHSIVHILLGVLGMAVAVINKEQLYTLYNKGIGIVYMLIGLLGFVPFIAPRGMLIGLIMINPADNLLHIAIGATLALVGFLVQEPRPSNPFQAAKYRV